MAELTGLEHYVYILVFMINHFQAYKTISDRQIAPIDAEIFINVTNINKHIVFRRIVSQKDYSMPDTSILEYNDLKDDQFVVKTSSAIISVRQNRNTGEPLLLLHGGPGVPDYMQTTTAPILSDFRCISFDQRGVGKSKCLDGKYDIDSYVDDIESIRVSLGIKSWHVLGHSWGGLLAQAYASAHPNKVKSLALISSSLGVGGDWKQTKRESFRIEHSRAGFLSNLRVYAYGSGLIAPNHIASWSMRHVMTETWHDYFLDPKSAPDPDPVWLAGCSPVAMIKTDRAISRASQNVLEGLSEYTGPVMVIYGAYDIFDYGIDIVRRRFPKAFQVTLNNSGHLHWLQNPSAYKQVLRKFYKQP